MRKLNLLLCICCLLLYTAYMQLQVAATTTDDADDELRVKFLPDVFAKTNFTLEDAKRLLRKKCLKNGVDNPYVYERLENATVQLMECTKDLVNFTLILKEVELARPTGELDVVFEKYCDKREHVKQCFLNFNEELKLCMSAAELAENAVVVRIMKTLLEFTCYKNGAQIALFIAEEGPECLEANKEQIAVCLNQTYSVFMPKQSETSDGLVIEELPDLVIGPQECIDLHHFEECVVAYVETCKEITPSNIIESVFRYIRNETRCQPEIDRLIGYEKLMARNSSMQSFITFSAGLGALGAVIFFRFFMLAG